MICGIYVSQLLWYFFSERYSCLTLWQAHISSSNDTHTCTTYCFKIIYDYSKQVYIVYIKETAMRYKGIREPVPSSYWIDPQASRNCWKICLTFGQTNFQFLSDRKNVCLTDFFHKYMYMVIPLCFFLKT
jgi:hypothetical protein